MLFRSFGTQSCPQPPACQHQYWDTSGQAASWAGTQHHTPAGQLPQDPSRQPPLGPGPIYQRARDPAPHTSAWALALGHSASHWNWSWHQQAETNSRTPQGPVAGNPRTQLCPPGVRQQTQDILGLGPYTSPGNSKPCTQKPQDAALPTSVLALTPGPSLTHQWANTYSGTPQTPQLAMSGTGPTHQQADSSFGTPQLYRKLCQEPPLPTSRQTLDQGTPAGSQPPGDPAPPTNGPGLASGPPRTP